MGAAAEYTRPMPTLILDYGMGNVRSVQKAFEHLGERATIGTDIARADRLVIPGVGAFGEAMANLAPYANDLRAFARSGQPMLGICLGQQLLFETSEEHGEHQGLGILPGRVRYFPPESGLKVPMIGWAPLQVDKPQGIMRQTPSETKVYFVHSLYVKCDPEYVTAFAEYGIRYAAAVQLGNVHATQFHPEKSSHAGLAMLEEFLKCS